MRFRFPISALLLTALSLTAVVEGQTAEKEADPPPLNKALTSIKPDASLLSSLLSVKPQIPLGPEYILEGYENQMTLVSQKMTAELQSIDRALHSGEITRAGAEYLIQQCYQIAMMQYEVFSALHDALEEDIQQSADKSKSSSAAGSVGTVVTGLALSSSHSQGQ